MEPVEMSRVASDPQPLNRLPRAEAHRRLERLGFRDEDRQAAVEGLDRLTSRDLALVDEFTARLAERVGLLSGRVAVLSDDGEADHEVGRGYLAILALAAAAPLVEAELTRRGLSEETARHSVADLGQQVHIHRLVHGEFGLSEAAWVSMGFTGSLVWLDRLQFTVEFDDHWGWVLGCHIPETGPLAPEQVDHSLARAARELIPAFPEFEFSRVTCRSWLLDQGLAARLRPESNVVRFARRFTPYGTPIPGRRDALFFGFHVETKGGRQVDLDALPRSNSLQRAILDQLAESGVVVQPGWLPLPGN